jgi:DNA-binding PadR family transcriptional regulator
MRKKELTESMSLVLLALYKGAESGIEISDYVEQITNSSIKLGPATLYTILSTFTEKEYILADSENGQKYKYQITDKGINAFKDEFFRLCGSITNTGSGDVLEYEE